MNSSVELVKFKKTLKGFHLEKSLKALIREKITAINDFIKLKLDTELTKFVCNIVENAITKKSKKNKIDKKALVLEVLTEIFNLKPDEQTLVKGQVEYLHSNNEISKIPMSEFVFGLGWSWIKRKLL